MIIGDGLSAPWRAAFEQVWEAYCNGSIPIGAALADAEGHVIATGRSRQYERDAPSGQVAWSKLSHAEMNALLQVSAHDHPNIRGCTLYTTVEPCPLCFGALVMSNVRNLSFAARDAWAGSTNLRNANEYITSKPIQISGPDAKLEILSTAINTEYFLHNDGVHHHAVVDAWERDCPEGVRLGTHWFEQGTLVRAKELRQSLLDVIKETLVP